MSAPAMNVRGPVMVPDDHARSDAERDRICDRRNHDGARREYAVSAAAIETLADVCPDGHETRPASANGFHSRAYSG